MRSFETWYYRRKFNNEIKVGSIMSMLKAFNTCGHGANSLKYTISTRLAIFTVENKNKLR